MIFSICQHKLTNGPISTRLPLNGFSHTGLALPDSWGCGKPGQIHVLRNEDVFVGKAGLKRGDGHFAFSLPALIASFLFSAAIIHPAALAGRSLAVPCHPSVRHLGLGGSATATPRTHVARNCIYCSVADLGILALSDGDYDGDKLQVTADKEASTLPACVRVSVCASVCCTSRRQMSSFAEAAGPCQARFWKSKLKNKNRFSKLKNRILPRIFWCDLFLLVVLFWCDFDPGVVFFWCDFGGGVCVSSKISFIKEDI